MARGVKMGIGIPAILIGVVSTIGGLAMLALFGTDGRFTTPRTHAATAANAIVLDAGFVEDDLPVRGSFATTITIAARSVDGGELFVGVGDRASVDAYLEGVSIAEAQELEYPGGELVVRDLPGRAEPTPPADQTFWVASADDEGVAEWKLGEGDWSVVVMNADGSAGVDVEGEATLDLPFLGTLTIVALVIGLPALAIGLAFVVSALRHPPEPVSAPPLPPRPD